MNITVRQNVTNFAISQYSDFLFDRGIATVNGTTFLLRCDALCSLTGATDGGTDIDAVIQTGSIAFGDGEKRVRSVHVKGKFPSKRGLAVDYGMDGLEPGTTATVSMTSKVGTGNGGSLQFNGERATHGEHLSARVRNVDGADFTINKIDAFLVGGCRR